MAVAVTGTAAGLVGLVLVATPAGAGGQPPPLPPINAEALVRSVLTTTVPAMSGSVQIKENLGLPMPLLPTGGADGIAARVHTDGTGKARISLTRNMAETTVVADGSTVWIWDSGDRSVRKIPHGAQAEKLEQLPERMADPAGVAQRLVAAMQADSTVSVDGTAMVAERAVYQLVLTPKPTEKTLLREVRVAVDEQTRVPLRLEVLANGQAEPALRVGFTEFSPGAQDPGLFQFSVPQGATVTESKPGEHASPEQARGLLDRIDPKVVGTGWDTVLIGKVPSDLLSSAGQRRGQGAGQPDVASLLRQFAKQVNGSFGTGWVVSTKVGSVLLTADGRVAIGAVPEQVLVDAVGTVR